MGLFAGSSGDTDIEYRLVDTVSGEGEGGTNGESNMETYMPPYAKLIAGGNLLYEAEDSNQGSVTS